MGRTTLPIITLRMVWAPGLEILLIVPAELGRSCDLRIPASAHINAR
jgi:hypothetical protein